MPGACAAPLCVPARHRLPASPIWSVCTDRAPIVTHCACTTQIASPARLQATQRGPPRASALVMSFATRLSRAVISGVRAMSTSTAGGVPVEVRSPTPAGPRAWLSAAPLPHPQLPMAAAQLL